jgi:hypothetical protein
MDACEACKRYRGSPISRSQARKDTAEVIADIQRRALNGIALVAEKALARAP